MIRACDGHHGHGETGCGFSTSTWPSGECPMCGGAMIDAPVPAPPAPRRPVAGWVEVEPGMWELPSGKLIGVVDARGNCAAHPEWWIASDDVWCAECGERDDIVIVEGESAPNAEAAQLAAEDALLAVLTDAARALGKRVVP